ncbi:NAD(P)-dependent oxidoreductase [Bradyrhizobium sp. B120]|uniref:NAD(P)-dependent oxidoreductase n=1 Tax=Bradyrhizobium sp. B120 TaxID=3410088 RepID=UPI003B97FD5B
MSAASATASRGTPKARVLSVRRNKGAPADNVDAMYGVDELVSILPQCDYVVVATPNTLETIRFFGQAHFDAMKPTAVLVNVARGKCIQEEPPHEALTTGRLRGFAADVWSRYEFRQSFPIGYMSRLEVHKLPNVIGSLGERGNTDDVLERHLQFGCENISDFALGRTIRREVNLDLGY